jgi:hypothetical protein
MKQLTTLLISTFAVFVISWTANADSGSDMLGKAGAHVGMFSACAIGDIYDEGTFEVYNEDADFLWEKYEIDASFAEGHDKAVDGYYDANEIKKNLLCLFSLTYLEGFRAGRELNSN